METAHHLSKHRHFLYCYYNLTADQNTDLCSCYWTGYGNLLRILFCSEPANIVNVSHKVIPTTFILSAVLHIAISKHYNLVCIDTHQVQ